MRGVRHAFYDAWARNDGPEFKKITADHVDVVTVPTTCLRGKGDFEKGLTVGARKPVRDSRTAPGLSWSPENANALLGVPPSSRVTSTPPPIPGSREKP